MYKFFAAVLLLLFCLNGLTLFAEESVTKNYEITINGKTYDIALGEDNTFTDGGKSLKVVLKKKEVVDYTDGMISFRHKSDANVASTDLGSGITQLIISSAVGTVFLVQEYTALNPSGMVDLMMQELTKQDISYGYEKNEEDVVFTTSDDKIMKGKKATLTYKKNMKVYQVLSYGKRDNGLLLMTVYDMNFFKQDKPMLDLMMGSIKLNF